MNKEIQDAFTDGIYDVYSIMFTDGISDGIKLYLFDEETRRNFYKESKVKRFKPSKLLVAKAEADMQEREKDDYPEDDFKNHPTFTVPYKSLRGNDISCQTEEDFRVLRKAYIEFHKAFYEVQKVSVRTFIEDVFEFITFKCVYRPDIDELTLTVDGITDEEVSLKSEDNSSERFDDFYGSMSKLAGKESNSEKSEESASENMALSSDDTTDSKSSENNLESESLIASEEEISNA